MPGTFPRCEILPLPNHEVAFRIDGTERTRWHFGTRYPRPFFYPFIGPSGVSLTRIGHPGAPNHDHHRSVWFGHAKVLGIDFWSENSPANIRQLEWLAYQDSDDEAVMAVRLGWFDGHDPKALLEQELIAAVRPETDGAGWFLEIQATFRPAADGLEFGQTNFGFLAVRVAKHLSVHFGEGRIVNSHGAAGEANVFGRPAEWVDYSGPSPAGGREGITYFDHPSNVGYPHKWHVREDGWMGASACLDGPVAVRRDAPLVLRYLLHVHAGDVNAGSAGAVLKDYASRPVYVVKRSGRQHRQYEIEPAKE